MNGNSDRIPDRIYGRSELGPDSSIDHRVGWADYMGDAGTPTCHISDGICGHCIGLGGIGRAGLLWIVIGLTIIWWGLHKDSPSSGIWRLSGPVGDLLWVGKYV